MVFRRGAAILIVALIAVLLGAGLCWWLWAEPATPTPVHATEVEDPADGPVLEGGAAAPPAAKADATPDPSARPWFASGTVTQLRPVKGPVRVVAHWWSKKPAGDEPPERVIRTEPLDLSAGPAPWRLEGHEDGHVVLLLDVGGVLQRYNPWVAKPGHAARAGFGWGPGPGVVGTYAVRGRALDAADQPVADAKLVFKDLVKGWHQVARTDAEGRFALDGLQSDVLEMTYTGRAVQGFVPEFATLRGRRLEIPADAREVVVRMHRNPYVMPKWGATIDGRFFRGGGMRLYLATVDDEGNPVPTRSRMTRGHTGFYIAPGVWQIGATIWGQSIDGRVRTYAVDERVEVSFSWKPREGMTLLGVEFDREPDGSGGVLRCAGAAEQADPRQGPQSELALGSRSLLVLAPGDWNVGGAIVRRGDDGGDAVRIAPAVSISLVAGERRALLLRTVSAAGVTVPHVEDGEDDPRLVLAASDRRITLNGTTLLIQSLGTGWRDTTWWLAPGRYRFDLLNPEDEERVLSSLEGDLEAGRVVPVHSLKPAKR